MGAVKLKLGGLLAGEGWRADGKQLEEPPVLVEQLWTVGGVVHG